MSELSTIPIGAHAGIDYVSYHLDKGIRATELKHFTGMTPKYAKMKLDEPDEDNVSISVGHASHTAALEPDKYEELYAIFPKAEFVKKYRHPNCTAYKEAHKIWQQANKYKTSLTDTQHANAMSIRKALRSHGLASDLLFNGRGVNELTAIGEIEHNGEKVRTKIRIDRLTEIEHKPAICDIKTIAPKARALDPYKIEGEITDRKYYQQAAWQLDRLNDHSPADRLYIYIFVENHPPYDVVCYMLEPEAIEQGRRDNNSALTKLLHGRKTGHWPGFSNDLLTVSIRQHAINEGIT